eukprot:12394913-Prorocentrum_lima.AAC.1
MEDLRPIALTSLWYRLMGRLLKPRINCCVSSLLPPWVLGFRAKRRPAEIHTIIRRMRERCWEWGLELAVGRLDIAGAFDGVGWEQLLQLTGQLLPPWIQHLLEQ